jgi:thioredoxin-dependent peroxiredoxin
MAPRSIWLTFIWTTVLILLDDRHILKDPMRLSTGSRAPALRTTDFLGEAVDLAALQGRPVLLSFYRYASCPVCNFRVHALIGTYPEWSAQGLEVIGVFQSSAKYVAQYVGRQDAPFPIVPDPQMQHYKRFGVEARWGGLFSWNVIKTALSAFRQGYWPGRVDGPFQRVPADFLIDRQGRIAMAHYGKDIDDHIPLATIAQWLTTQQA